jgi:O-antigen/teichoic acid export membrane protein
MDEVLAVVDQAAVSGANFLATVAVARWAGAAELGAYALGMSIVFILLNIQRSLIVLPYAVRQSQTNDLAGLTGHCLVQSALFSAAVTAALGAAALIFYATRAHAGTVTLLLALAWLAPIAILREFVRQLCFTHRRLRQVLIADCATLLLQTVGLLWLGMSQHISAPMALICSSAGIMPIIAIWLYLNRGYLRIECLRLRESVRQNWSLGRWLLATQLTATVNASIAVWLLTLMLGAEPAGIYAACAALASIANPAVVGLNNMLVPRAVTTLRQQGVQGLKSQMISDAILLGVIMAVFNILLAITSTGLITLLYRAAYMEHYRVVQAVALASLLSAVGIAAANGLTASEKPQGILWAGLCGIAVTAGLGVLLVANYGVTGAGYAVLAGNLVGTAGRWIDFLRVGRGGQPTNDCAVQAVLREVDPTRMPGSWTLRLVDEGSQAKIYTAKSDTDNHGMLAVKLYKPSVSPVLARQQFCALARLHRTLNGQHINGWAIAVPAPIYLSETPLALAMTVVPGRSLLHHVDSRACAIRWDEMTTVAAVIAAALTRYWARNQLHGDFNLGNILCNFEARTLSFIDPGALPNTVGNLPEHLYPSSRDLAYLLHEAVTTISHSRGRPGVEIRKSLFAKAIIRSVLVDIPAVKDKHRFLNEIQCCARICEGLLEISYTPQGIWRGLLRCIARWRVATLIRSLRMELTILEEPRRDFGVDPVVPGLALQDKQ